MKTLTVLLVILLSGCAVGSPVNYSKSGATNDDFLKDQRECKYDAIKSSQGTDNSLSTMVGQEIDRAMRRNTLMKECMSSRGYSS
jgi:hypothetical protein